MIWHLAILQFADDVPAEQLDEIVNRIKALRGVVPGIASLDVGVATDAQGQRLPKVALVGAFETQEALDAYTVHPGHVQVGQLVRERTSAVSGADFVA